jgi:hypothetical protein
LLTTQTERSLRACQHQSEHVRIRRNFGRRSYVGGILTDAYSSTQSNRAFGADALYWLGRICEPMHSRRSSTIATLREGRPHSLALSLTIRTFGRRASGRFRWMQPSIQRWDMCAAITFAGRRQTCGEAGG